MLCPPPKLGGPQFSWIHQISICGMLYMKSYGFMHSKIIGIGFNAINWRFDPFPPKKKLRGPKLHELIKLQWDAYCMKSNGITTSKMIEI